MRDFTAQELRPGYVLVSGNTVMHASTWGVEGERITRVATQNGERYVTEYPADTMFYDVDTTFYDLAQRKGER